ncbi:MAG: outer membrane homotrimeric porin [Desulfovibrionaceae bacterium]
MKRFVLLALVAAFVLGTFGMASAETKVTMSGEHYTTFQWAKSVNGATNAFTEKDGEDTFYARQRSRIYMNFEANENVKATYGFEIGDLTWGHTESLTPVGSATAQDIGGATGGDFGADGINIKTKRAMVAFTVPNTDLKVTMGIQGMALPIAVAAANPIFNGDVAGITASYAFNDMFSATALWARVKDNNGTDIAGSSWADEEDGIGLILSIAPVQGLSLKPYYLYGMIGQDVVGGNVATKDESAWWLGMSTQLTMFDPIVVLWDVMYGSYDGATDARDKAGWSTDIAVAYKMDFMTPTLVFHYGTGDDSTATDGSEGLPTLGHDTNYAITNLGTDGNIGRSSASKLIGTATKTDAGMGVMGIGLVLDKITFVENLSNTLKIVYYKGTNDKSLMTATPATFTEEDSAWEINLDTTYQLYENLSAVVELGYVNVDWDDNAARGSNFLDEDAYKLAFSLIYKF